MTGTNHLLVQSELGSSSTCCRLNIINAGKAQVK